MQTDFISVNKIFDKGNRCALEANRSYCAALHRRIHDDFRLRFYQARSGPHLKHVLRLRQRLLLQELLDRSAGAISYALEFEVCRW